jgi:hypothetical protein
LAATYTPKASTDPSVSDGVAGGVYILARHSNAQSLKRVRLTLVQPYVKAA